MIIKKQITFVYHCLESIADELRQVCTYAHCGESGPQSFYDLGPSNKRLVYDLLTHQEKECFRMGHCGPCDPEHWWSWLD